MNNPFAESLWPACYSGLHFDRFLLGELSKGDAEELRLHLAGCARCTACLESLRPGEPLPPLRVAATGAGQAAEAGQAAGAGQAVGAGQVLALRPRRWTRPLAAAAGIAAAASLLLVLRAPAPSERRKGSGFALAMYVQHGEAVRRAAPGESVAPGDAVRFAITAPAAGYVAVLTVDPEKRASIYFPLGDRAAPISAGLDLALPQGTRLDATTGEEHLTALFCTAPVELAPLRAALEQGALQLPDGCQETHLRFVKR